MTKDEKHSCYNCVSLIREEESWEMPHIWWWECTACPGMANLKSFPFENTKCKAYVRRETPIYHKDLPPSNLFLEYEHD